MRNGLIRLSRAAVCVAACFGGVASTAAAPTLPSVVAGQASFTQDGNVFSITNTPGAIINWQSFSVNAGEITRFIQQSADSAVLNRIVGQDPSRILGALQSNGKVFLINPNGVVFGRDARVDVGGLVASTLNLSDADFQAGKKNFTAGPTAGSVRNEGSITTPSGGKVFLVAPNVENSGVITAPNGEVVLAAGRSVQLVDSTDPNLTVVVSAADDQAINLGRVISNGGRIGIYGALVNQRGVVNADSAVVGQDGRIVLKASRDAMLEAGSVTTAYRVQAEAGNELTIGAAVTSTGGDIDLRANNHLRLLEGGTLASPDYIDLRSDRMTLAGMIGGVEDGGQLPVVSFNPFSNTTDIVVNRNDVSGALTLNPARLAAFKAYGISIGNSGHTGDVVIDDALNLAGNLVIDTAGRIQLNARVRLDGATSQFLAELYSPGSTFEVNNASAIDAVRKISVSGAGRIHIDGKLNAGEIALDAGSAGIGLTADLTATSRVNLRTDGALNQGNALVRSPALLVDAASVNMLGNNQVGTLAGAATGTGADAGFRFRWTGGLRIGSVGDRAGVAGPGEVSLTGGDLIVDATGAEGQGVTTGSGDISLVTNSSLTILGKVSTDSGNVRLVAGNGGLLTIDGAGRVASGSGSVSVSAGDTAIRAGSIVVASADKLSVVRTNPQKEPEPTPPEPTPPQPTPPEPTPPQPTPPEPTPPEPTPPLDTCLSTPGASGCSGVIEAATRSCMANPEGPQCAQVLPPVDTCRTNPSRLGCSVVMQREEIRQCIATPTAPGCGETLPPLASCRADAGLYGCAPVLERAEFLSCVASPASPGCAARLPALSLCKATPGIEGCAQVIQLTFTACLVAPNDPSCSGILPTLSQCVNDKTAAGCQAVLPTLQQCIGSPTLQGCSVQLPKLEQCAVNPNLAGCEAVLPKPDLCSSNPADPRCVVFNPAQGGGGSKQPVAEVLQNTVALINTRTPAQEKLPATAPVAAASGNGSSTTGNGGAGGGASEGKTPAEQPETAAGPAASTNTGVKNEKPATKMYCN